MLPSGCLGVAGSPQAEDQDLTGSVGELGASHIMHRLGRWDHIVGSINAPPVHHYHNSACQVKDMHKTYFLRPR